VVAVSLKTKIEPSIVLLDRAAGKRLK